MRRAQTATRARAHGIRAERYARDGNARKAAAHYNRALWLLRFGGDGETSDGETDAGRPQCVICLDSDPPPIQSGCACRSDAGLAHVECKLTSAAAQVRHRGTRVWSECQTCGQKYTGTMRTALAEARWARARGEASEASQASQAETSAERLAAASNLAHARQSDGQYADAERIFRDVLAALRRGGETPTRRGAPAHADGREQPRDIALGARQARGALCEEAWG